MNEYIHIGKFVAVSGLQGELLLKHVLGKKTVFKAGEVVFIEKDKNIPLPFFIQKNTAKNNTETLLKIEGIDTREKAISLLQKKAWLTKDDFEKYVSKTAPVNLIDFIVIDKKEKLGKVEAVIEQPQQVLLQITIQSNEVLIPLHEKTLKKIDRRNKEIHVELPEGLVDIYLGK